MKKNSFTLVELLIVIIILGILATIAVPQYNKMVWKSRFAEVYNVVGIIAHAEEMYYAEHGCYADQGADWDQAYMGWGYETGGTKIQQDLGIDIPSSCLFQYFVYPDGFTWTGIQFGDFKGGYDWAWYYNYSTKKWGKVNNGGAGGPAQAYFVPPAGSKIE